MFVMKLDCTASQLHATFLLGKTAKGSPNAMSKAAPPCKTIFPTYELPREKFVNLLKL
jgi:hypothetical protein